MYTTENLKKKLKLIEKEFLKITGKPFLPSPKDISLLLNWLEKGVPLWVIVEGIKAGWEKRKRRNPSIFSFKRYIEKAIISYRERIVGSKNRVIEKENLMIEEISNFLKNLPSELEFVKEIFEKALKILKSRKKEAQKMEILERLESQLESSLLEKFSIDGVEPSKTLKSLRIKYRIPRLLRFYY